MFFWQKASLFMTWILTSLYSSFYFLFDFDGCFRTLHFNNSLVCNVLQLVTVCNSSLRGQFEKIWSHLTTNSPLRKIYPHPTYLTPLTYLPSTYLPLPHSTPTYQHPLYLVPTYPPPHLPTSPNTTYLPHLPTPLPPPAPTHTPELKKV